jgi:L-aspartate oxidase
MEKYSYDTIIIGEGLAGLLSAYHASKSGSVAVFAKSDLKQSCSYLAQGGIAAALAENDSPRIHYNDTIRVGRGLCSKKAVRILVGEGAESVAELIGLGMRFDKHNGKLEFGLEGGHSRRRILHSNGTSTGRGLVEFALSIVRKNKNIDFYPGSFVYELVVENGICAGIKIFNPEKGRSYRVVARTVIIAAGGATGIYNRTTNPATSAGDGIALAYNAGAVIENMEFIQFHPTVLSVKGAPGFLLSEALRGEGAEIVDESGKRILPAYGKTELSPRDELSRVIFMYMQDHGAENVYLKLSHLDGNKIKKRFSYIFEELKKLNIDITKDLIPIAPAAHYTIGGIKTGLWGETNIKGLYAVGETASSRIHGANRLASNSLLECVVFSKRAVLRSAMNLGIPENKLPVPEKKLTRKREYKVEYEKVRKLIGTLMWENVGILRSKSSLNEVKKILGGLEEEYYDDKNDYYRKMTANVIRVASLIAAGAALRKESRGCHLNKDYPLENPEFERSLCIKRRPETGDRRPGKKDL